MISPKLIRSGNFYVAIREDILQKGTFESKPFHPYIMGGIDPATATLEEKLHSRVLGLNIDDREDWDLVKCSVNRGDIKV